MKWLTGYSKKREAAKGFANQTTRQTAQTFILEPILTPSGILDGGDDTPNPLTLDWESNNLPDVDTVDNTTEVEDATQNEISESNSNIDADSSHDEVAVNSLEIDIADEELETLDFIDKLDVTEAVENEPTPPETTASETLEVDSPSQTTDSDVELPTITNNEDPEEISVAAEVDSPKVEITNSSNSTIDEADSGDSQLTTDLKIDSDEDLKTSDLKNEVNEFDSTLTGGAVNETTEDILDNISLAQPNFDDDSGVFTVGETGEVGIDFLFDGGKYKGELAIFSLEEMDEFEPGSQEFIKEATSRALSSSELGHVIISDASEGAKFSGNLGENNFNSGTYSGVKTFAMRPGDTFAVMLVPNGKVEQVFNNPSVGGALRPLFSLVTSNPNDAFHVGQIADVTGDGNTFVMEDVRVDQGSDRDYNDIIFQVRGARGNAALMDDVVANDKDWRGSDLGQALIAYAEPYIEPEIIDDLELIDEEIPFDDDLNLPDEVIQNPVDESLPPTDNQEVADLPTSDNVVEDSQEVSDELTNEEIIVDKSEAYDESISDNVVEDKPEISDEEVAENSTDSQINEKEIIFSSPAVKSSTDEVSVANEDVVSDELANDRILESLSPASANNENEQVREIADSEIITKPIDVEEVVSKEENAIASPTITTTQPKTEVTEIKPAITVNNSSPTVVEKVSVENASTSTLTPVVPETKNVDSVGELKADSSIVKTVETGNGESQINLINSDVVVTESKIASNSPITSTAETTTAVTVTETQNTAVILPRPAVSAKPPIQFEFLQENQPLVGIIDKGFSANNPDIDYSRIILGQDRVDGDTNPLVVAGEGDTSGTSTLGVIGATQNNQIGINGINDDAPLWVGRAEVNSDQWAQSLMEFVDAAKTSQQPNAVVNLSFNLTNPDGTPRFELTAAERAALAYAQRNNVLIVASAGDNPGQMSALGKAGLEFDNIITVGAAERVNNSVALSKAFAGANYSGSGAGLDIVADGGSAERPITVTSGEGTAKEFGTSVATAKVTGAASQVWAANPKLNFTQVIDILKRTATDLGKPNWDAQTGAGLLNIAAAVTLAKVTTPEPYTVKPGQETITDNFISQNNPDKQLPGDPAHPAVTPPGIPRTTVDQGANDLSGTRIRISATEDVIDQVSSIDPIDVYRGASRELAGAKFKVLTGQAMVSILSTSGQVLSQQVLSRGTHNLQMPANAPAEVLLKIDPHGGDATYVLQGFEAERNEPFDINLEFESPLTASQQQIMQAAARSVASLIGKGLPSAVVDGKIIDDINIKVSTANLDGASGTQARTKIDFMRYGTLLPAQSITQFDAADIAELERSGQLFSVAQHEFLHALGFGNLWEAKGLVDYAGTPLAQYNGKQAVDAFKDLGGLTDAISLETEGKGSAGFHWNEALFQDEVMTYDLGFKQGSDGKIFSPISAVTIASLADLGYQVNLNRATPDFGLFGGGRFNPDELTPEQIEAFRQLAEESVANQSGEFIPAIMPEVDPNKVAPEIWAHAEKFSKNGEYYDWEEITIGDWFAGHTISDYVLQRMTHPSKNDHRSAIAKANDPDYWRFISNKNGFPDPNWIVKGNKAKVPVWHPNYEWKQEQERLRREEELRQRQEEEERIRREQEEQFRRDEERRRQEEEARRQEAERQRRELEEQERRLREEMERRRLEEERRKEEERLRELARQAEIARQQGKGGLDWYIAKPLPEFGPVDPFETSLTGETVGNLVPDDYYRFTLSRGGRITAELRKLLADADLVLYDVRNEPIAYSMREGVTDEQIIADLIPGTYLLRVNSPKGVTTDYELIVKFKHKLSQSEIGPPPGWKPGASNGGNGGSNGQIPPGATFADPRIEKIFKQAVADFAAPERRKARSKVDALRAERDRLEREKKALIASKSAELRGKVHGMLDRVKSDQQGNVNSIANNIKGGIDGVANGAIGAINGLVPDWVFKTPFVGGWLRDRFNEAKGAIEGAINGARNWLKAKVDEVRNTINNAISWFIDQVKDAYFTAGEANIAIEGIAAQFRGMIENATAALNGLIGTFKGMVLSQIEWTRNIGVPGWNLYDNAIVGLVNNLTNGAQDAVRNTGRSFMDRVGDAEKGVQWVIAEIGNLLGDETGRIYNQYQDQIRSLNNQIEAITNDTDRRIRAKEAEYKNQIQNFLNQLGNEGKKILDTILNFANSPAGQISIAVIEVIIGITPFGPVLDAKDTAIAGYKMWNGDQSLGTKVELLASLAGWFPGLGDALKSVAKVALKGPLDELLKHFGSDVTQQVAQTFKDSKKWKEAFIDLVTKLSKIWQQFDSVIAGSAGWIIDFLPGFKPAFKAISGAIGELMAEAPKIGDELAETSQWIYQKVDNTILMLPKPDDVLLLPSPDEVLLLPGK